MRKLFILLLVLAVVMLCACAKESKTTSTSTVSTYRQITQSEAADIMENDKSCIILDVRTLEEYNEGHIPNAICIPNEIIIDKQPSKLPDKDQLILVYCRSGRRSKEAAEKLAAMGYSNIVEFGGIRDWTGKIVKE